MKRKKTRTWNLKKKTKWMNLMDFVFLKQEEILLNLISFFHEYSAIKLKRNECIPFDRTPWHF